MKCCNGANALDFVHVAARLDEPLAEQCDTWPVAEQKKTLRLGEADLFTGDIGASLALSFIHPGTRCMDAGKRCAVGLIGRDPNGRKHALGKNPGDATDRLTRSGIFQRGGVSKKHHGSIFGSMRKDPFGARTRQRKLNAACEPLLKPGKRFVARSGDVGFATGLRGRSGAWRLRLHPVARLFLNRDIDACVEPPRERASSLC